MSDRGIGVDAVGDLGVVARGGSSGIGLIASGGLYAVQCTNTQVFSTVQLSGQDAAGRFFGQVKIFGSLSFPSAGTLIDHPLDPENKTLCHSVVESCERKTVYDGTVVLGEDGEAWVDLPAWCEVLSCDFRYQLTPVGAHAPVYVADKITGHRFRIAGGNPGLEVCWQVTGVRHDPWAKANPLVPEGEKPAAERGTFFHPDLYGQPEEKGLAQVGLARVPEPERPE